MKGEGQQRIFQDLEPDFVILSCLLHQANKRLYILQDLEPDFVIVSLFVASGEGKPQHSARPGTRLCGLVRPRRGVRKNSGGVPGGETPRSPPPGGLLHAVRAKCGGAKVKIIAAEKIFHGVFYRWCFA